MNTNDERSETWGNCPPGALANMVASQQAKQRRASITRNSSVVAAVLLVGFTGWMASRLTQSGQGHLVGGIYCTDCIELMADYRANRLDQQQTVLMGEHLAGCGKCREKYEAMSDEARRTERHQEVQVGYLSHFHAPPPREFTQRRKFAQRQ